MQTFKHEFKKKLTTEEFENLARYELSGEPPIKKVLHVEARPKITSSESVDGSISYSGKTTYSVVYEAEDAQVRSLMFDAAWQGKTAGGEGAMLVARANESVVTGFTAADINISTLLNVDVYACASEQIDNATNLPSDYVLSQKTFDLQKAVTTTQGEVSLAGELDVNYKVEDVCLTTAVVRNLSATAQIDAISLSGEVDVCIITSSEGRLFEETKTISFKEEVASILASPSCLVDATARVAQLKTTASVSDIDKKSTLTISVELGVLAAVYQTEQVTLTRDAFSLTKELNMATECITADVYQGDGEKQDVTSGDIEVDTDLDTLDFAVVQKVEITDTIKTETGFELKGFVLAKAIGQAAGERVACNCYLPFATQVDDPAAKEFSASASMISAKLRGTQDIELNASLVVDYKKYATEVIDFISSLEEVGVVQERPSAVRVHVVKGGEDLFEVAKKLGVTTDQIVAQNPSLGEELTSGDRIVVYCPLSID